MKKFFVSLMCCLICLGINSGFAYDKDDLIDAINKTYKVAGEDFRLPSSIRNKAVNYIKANDITNEQCNELMQILDEAVIFANEIGTTDIDKVSSDDLKKGMAIVNRAASVLNMEVKVNATLDKVMATQKDTGKILEEVEKKEAFFKNTGKDRNNVLWTAIAILGLGVLIIISIVLIKTIKFSNLDFICNTILLLYIFLGMPFICFGNYIEILELLEPVLSSQVGEGYIDIVDVEIVGDKEPIDTSDKVDSSTDNNVNEIIDKNSDENINKATNVDEVIVKEPVAIKYPVLGQMYAKLNIPSCGINLPVYYGDNEKILDVGVGHFSGSHFPGQGKGIIYTTHNTKDKLYNLKNIKIGNKVSISTNFGEYNYKVIDIKVIKDTDKSKAYIESDKEILMIYTCYPFDTDGYTNERYMVYCERSEV